MFFAQLIEQPFELFERKNSGRATGQRQNAGTRKTALHKIFPQPGKFLLFFGERLASGNSSFHSIDVVRRNLDRTAKTTARCFEIARSPMKPTDAAMGPT